MAKFCGKCGRPLADGEVCGCAYQAAPAQQARPVNQAPQGRPVNYGQQPQGNPVNYGQQPQGKPAWHNGNGGSVNIDVKKLAGDAKRAAQNANGLWTKVKNQIGIGDPLMNESGSFEKDMRIIPDCVKPNDGEVPVKQYEVATLRNRVLGITYMKARGRIQVTNKRVIFRAPGRCIAGRTTLQHEFSIDEIAGIEARREFIFNFWDLIIGLIVFVIGAAIGSFVVGGLSDEGNSRFLALLISLFFAAGAAALFFLVKKKWLLKLLGLGSATVPLILFGLSEQDFVMFLMLMFAIPFVIISMFTFLLYAIRPNLALLIKTKAASAEAIDIKRRSVNVFSLLGGKGEAEDHTGYSEILPEDDAELSIRELGAVITDIQKLGDFGIEKWKE